MIHCSVSTVAITRYHLLQVPPNGGRPIMLKQPISMAPKVIGITRPRPRIWLMSVLWLAVGYSLAFNHFLDVFVSYNTGIGHVVFFGNW